MAYDPFVGAAFEKLISAIADARSKAARFDSNLRKLDQTLSTIKPNILQMKRLNDDLDRPNQEMENLIRILEQGEKLIQKCSKVRWWNYIMKWRWANKIKDLEASLLKYSQMELQFQNSRDVKQILSKMRSNGGVFSSKYGSFGSCAATDPPAFTVGLDVPLRELKRLLMGGASRIVVSAPGGCGKTTLAKRFCQDHQVKDYFRANILYVTVSKTFDLIGIIKKLFGHGDEAVPEFRNEEDAVNHLELLLKDKVKSGGSILLVLDDVWCGSESALAKFEFQIPEYKVLVTSRNEFPGFAPTYKLKLLNEKDARALFCHSVMPEGGSCRSMPSEDLVNKIVGHCKGFPLALQVVGSSLSGQPVETWRSTLMRLSGGQSIVNYEDQVRDCLQRSLDALGDKDSTLKECFVDLGSFPEDQKIPVTALIDMWMELHKPDRDEVHAIADLHKLCSRNLLNLEITRNDGNEICGWYNDAYVTQHDLLRDLAIYQSNQKPLEMMKRLIVDLTGNGTGTPRWWTSMEQPRLTARLVSISTDEKFSSSSWPNMQIPEAKVLILSFNQRQKEYQLPDFMKQMDELQVLVVTNYGFSATELTNFPILSCLPNLKRIRLEKVTIPKLSNTSLVMRNLEKLSLVMCHKIGEAFSTSTINIPEMFPKLREINIDYSSDLVELPKGFCNLVGLNRLSIANCHKLSALPEEIGNLENLEVLRVRACTKVPELPDSIVGLRKLRVLDITACIKIKKLPKQIGKLQGLREFHMRSCSGLLEELPPSVTDLMDLERVICDEETSKLWECFRHLLPGLTLSVLQETVTLNWLPRLKGGKMGNNWLPRR